MADTDISTPTGPHTRIAVRNNREKFLTRLFDTLWDRYRQRVSYVQEYERVIADAGATLVNDHIAFRTLAGQRRLSGMASVSRVFEALGYRCAGCYNFPDKKLSALHYQHANAQLPKLFISELRTWELSARGRCIAERCLGQHRDPISADTLAELAALDEKPAGPAFEQLLEQVVAHYHTLPWSPPEKVDVEAMDEESQYAAWVLVHGYNVNHFTSLINSHGVDSLSNIEKTTAALCAAGVPMKEGIEGAAGSKLRQTATRAVTIDVDISHKGEPATMPWTYAYFELAERGHITDPHTQQRARFEGFLGPQATQLFEMTRRS